MWRVVWSITKFRILFSGILRGIEVGLNFGMVYAVTAVIEFLNGQSSSRHMAITAAILLFVRTVLCSLCYVFKRVCLAPPSWAVFRKRYFDTSRLAFWLQSALMYVG
jgi:hypothetical protein